MVRSASKRAQGRCLVQPETRRRLATSIHVHCGRYRLSLACVLCGISRWRDGALYPLAGGSRRIWRGEFWLRGRRGPMGQPRHDLIATAGRGAALITLVVITRARAWAARCQPTCSTCSGRLGGAAAANRTMVRSPAAPSLFRFNGLSFRDSGSARPVMTSASPGRGGAGRAQRATGSSTTVAKFRSNDSAG